MPRNALVPLFAALALLTGATTFAQAADLSSSHRAYNQNRDRVQTYENSDENDYAPRKKYQEEAYRDDNRWEGRRWHHRHWQSRLVEHIEARASYAGDYMPYYVKEWRAKRSAIDAWKSKVANRYGEDFAHWRMAEDKRVDCDAAAGSVYCTVSGRPQRGSASQWSNYRDRDYR